MLSRASLAEQVGSLFGTVIAVFLVMAANECGSDAGVMVLLKSLGSLAQLPYYFFSVGTIGCAEGGAALVSVGGGILPVSSSLYIKFAMALSI